MLCVYTAQTDEENNDGFLELKNETSKGFFQIQIGWKNCLEQMQYDTAREGTPCYERIMILGCPHQKLI